MEPAIVVTGASSGIGRALALVAAREGSFMMLVADARQPLDEFAAELKSGGAQADALCLDLTDRGAGVSIENALSERGLYCDVLVNGAGVGLLGNAADIDRVAQLNLLDVNARALTDLTLRFLPGMLARGRGGILNVGSITGYVPVPKMALYSASKAYVKSFSAALAAEVSGRGVTVTCLSPGIVRTAFFDRAGMGHTRLIKIMPRSNAEATAAVGWRAFKAGRRVVIPRLIDRMLTAFGRALPQSIVLRWLFNLQQPR